MTGVFLAAMVLAHTPAAGEAPACRLEPLTAGTVASVNDGRTFVLADGREVRLAGIEVAPLAEPDGPEAKAGAAAKAAAEGLLIGREVVLKRLGEGTDRHGRLLAHAFTSADGAERWVQADLVAAGHARVSARVGDRACAAELMRLERAARAAKLGLWAEPYYVTRRAEDAAAIAAARGRFTIVEGKVLSVRESGGTIYVNFGRRWSQDFTVTIAKRNERAFAAAGLEPKKLEGRVVRIRGWIEERGGPWIDARRPEQIELVERK